MRLAWPQASEADSGQGDEAEVEGVVEGPVLKRNCDLQYHARPQAVEQQEGPQLQWTAKALTTSITVACHGQKCVS